METVFLKLGGSLITDKSGDGKFHPELVTRLGEEIRSALAERPMRLILGHGAGSFAHVPAAKYCVKEGLPAGGGWEGYAKTRLKVIELNHLVLEALALADLYPLAVQPSATALAKGGKLVSMDVKPIERLLDAGQIPMVFGDAVLDEDLGFTIVSTEGFFTYLAQPFPPKRIVMASDVDGVYTADPKVKDEAARIGRIDSTNLEEVLGTLGAGPGADVTGGMASKVKAAHDLAWQCFDSEIRIVSGLMADRVREALTGRGGGTRVRA